METCKCCGQQLPPKISVTGKARKKLLEVLLRARYYGITRQALSDAVYADDENGGPDDERAICQLVHQARLQLIPQGWSIKSSRGPAATYRLIKVEENANRGVHRKYAWYRQKHPHQYHW